MLSFSKHKLLVGLTFSMMTLSFGSSAQAKCSSSDKAAEFMVTLQKAKETEETHVEPIRKKVDALGKKNGWEDEKTKAYLANLLVDALKPSKEQRKNLEKKAKKAAMKAAFGDDGACEELTDLNIELKKVTTIPQKTWDDLNAQVDAELAK